MISIDYGIHLSSKSNARGHWIHGAREAKAQRKTILNLVDLELWRRMASGQMPFELRKVVYRGSFKRQPATKTKFVRHLAPAWQKRLDRGVTVTLTRVAERALDTDNVRDAFKSMRDGVADAFGIADNDKRIAFEYRQERGTPSKINVRIEWLEEAHVDATPTA